MDKVVLKIKLTIVEYRRDRNIGICILFTHHRDIASGPLTKQNHLAKCSNGKLGTSTLVNDRTLRSIADFASAFSNIKTLIMLKILSCLICLRFL